VVDASLNVMLRVVVSSAINDVLSALRLATVGARVSTTKETVLLAALLLLPAASVKTLAATLTVAAPLKPASGVKVAV
jgi:hypothetical protein